MMQRLVIAERRVDVLISLKLLLLLLLLLLMMIITMMMMMMMMMMMTQADHQTVS